jgi:hypothetical protein
MATLSAMTILSFCEALCIHPTSDGSQFSKDKFPRNDQKHTCKAESWA